VRLGCDGSEQPQISPLRCAPVEMTKGRAALPKRVVAEHKPLGICGTRHSHSKPLGQQPHYPLSSRPERSAVERSAGRAIPIANLPVSSHTTLCHLDRSVAQWRDLRLRHSNSKPTGQQPHYPLSSRPERSAVERSAVRPIPIANLPVSSHTTLCHLDRSAAQWRDLRDAPFP
jgi:hypothetical protein